MTRTITSDDYVVTASGCWEWKHSRHPEGYGQMVGGRKAHRIAYAVHFGISLSQVYRILNREYWA